MTLLDEFLRAQSARSYAGAPGAEWRAGLSDEDDAVMKSWEAHPKNVSKPVLRKVMKDAPAMEGTVYRGQNAPQRPKGYISLDKAMEDHQPGTQIRMKHPGSVSTKPEVAAGFGHVVYQIDGDHGSKAIGNSLHEGVMPPGNFEVTHPPERIDDHPVRATIDGTTMFTSPRIKVRMRRVPEGEQKTAADSRDHRKPRLFYPTVGGGKYHEATEVMGHAHCRQNVELDTSTAPIHIMPGQEKVHPIVCRRCLNRKADESPFKVGAREWDQYGDTETEPGTSGEEFNDRKRTVSIAIGSRDLDFTKHPVQHMDPHKLVPTQQYLWKEKHDGAREHPEGSEVPPIHVLKVGDTHYVRDGHHRWDLAKEQGTTVPAHVVDASTLWRKSHVLTDWSPTERIFAPTKVDLDPRLFQGMEMLPEVTHVLMTKISDFMSRHQGHDWQVWARLYLAGSEASLWWGNNDFDILVGVEYDLYRGSNPENAMLSNEEITDHFNAAFRVDWNDDDWHPPFDPTGSWSLTGYVNPNSYDIRKIKPYAAYCVNERKWYVEPLSEPMGHHFNESEFYFFEGVAERIRHILALPEPQRSIRAKAFYDELHRDRSRAFGPDGSGIFDRGNSLEKYLDQAGLWEPLQTLRYASRFQRRAGSANYDNPERWAHKQKAWDSRKFEIEQTRQHGDYALHAEKMSPDDGDDRTIHATHGHQYVGEVFSGPEHPGDEHIKAASEIHPDHRRKGLASAMYDWSQELHGKPLLPDAPHSSDAAAFWADRQSKTASIRFDNESRSFTHADGRPLHPDDDLTLESLREIGRQAMAEEGGPCKCCGGSGEHRTGRECYGCDASGQWTGFYGPIPCDGSKPYGTDNEGHQVELDPMDGWQHLDGSVSHDDASTVSDHPVKHDQGVWPDVMPKTGVSVDHLLHCTAGSKKDPDPVSVSGVALMAGDTGRLLMIQRSIKDEKDPAAGTWEFPGGHHEDGDLTSLHAAIREWEEEVGQEFPKGGVVTHTWRSGPYQGHLVVIPSEGDIAFHEGRCTVNPDDPDGDDHEQSAWWEPEHARKNPALRSEIKENWNLFAPGLKTMEKTARVKTAPGPDGEKPDGIMIAIVPPSRIVEDLVLQDGEDPANFHVTLAYLGKITNYTEEQVEDLPNLVKAWAAIQPKMEARVQGVGTFVNEGSHVLWASVDMPGVTKMHVSLVEYLTDRGFGVADDHAFIPHMTLAYGKSHFRFMPKIAPATFKVNEVWCCVGERWESFPLAKKR